MPASGRSLIPPRESRSAGFEIGLYGRGFTSVPEMACSRDRASIGLVAVERLLAAADETPVSDLVHEPVVVLPDAGLEAAVREATKLGQRTVAVADSGQRFRGLVPSNRLLGVLELEDEEDLARLGGFLARAAMARTASEEAVGRRLCHRLPWLGLGLAGAMASAVIVGSFEEQLQEQVLLAFLVPAFVYMADVVGTQTGTIMIGAMSIGIRIRRLVLRELVSGLLIGLLISGAFFPFALGRPGDAGGAGAVAVALLVSGTGGHAGRDGAPLCAGPSRSLPRVRIRAARDGDPGPVLDPRLLRGRSPARLLTQAYEQRCCGSSVPAAPSAAGSNGQPCGQHPGEGSSSTRRSTTESSRPARIRSASSYDSAAE